MLGAVGRFAMNPKVLSSIGSFLKPAFANEAGKVTAKSIAGRVAPDIFFGGLAALQTPGDVFDKGSAFVGSSLGGIGGGAGATALTKKLGVNLGGFQEIAGGYLGDYAGQMASDTVSRGKDKLMGGLGETGWERMGREQQEEYAKQLEQQILAQYGLVPGGRADNYLASLGLA